MNKRTTLIHDGSLDRRMPVSERIHADATQQVEVLHAALVDQMHILSANEEDRVPLVGL